MIADIQKVAVCMDDILLYGSKKTSLARLKQLAVVGAPAEWMGDAMMEELEFLHDISPREWIAEVKRELYALR